MSEAEIGFDEAFRTGLITKESNEQLQKRLMDLCTGQIPNESVRHREIIRGITINHILLQRHIDKLNQRNTVLQWVIIVLAIVTIFTGSIQTYIAIKYLKQAPIHLTQQAVPKSEAAKSKPIQDEKTKEDQSKIPSKSLNNYGK